MTGMGRRSEAAVLDADKIRRDFLDEMILTGVVTTHMSYNEIQSVIKRFEARYAAAELDVDRIVRTMLNIGLLWHGPKPPSWFAGIASSAPSTWGQPFAAEYARLATKEVEHDSS